MKNSKYWLIPTLLCSAFLLKAQVCGHIMDAATADSLVLRKVIKEGKITEAEARRRMAAVKTTPLSLNRELKILFVSQRLKSRTINLKTAQDILRSCAKGSTACEVTFKALDDTPLEFVWSKDTLKAFQSWVDLGAVAISQNWYAQADVVVGLTNDPFNDYSGYSSIDSDCQPLYRSRIVIKANSSNSLFAHELGHTLGMIHDDAPVRLDGSVMLPTVPFNPTTMSVRNRDCYSKNTNSNMCLATATIDNEASGIEYAPNPVDNILTLSFTESVISGTIRMYNMLAHNILSKKFESNQVSIDMSGNESGVYILHINTPDKHVVKKVFKNK
jgi:hypothetical protein